MYFFFQPCLFFSRFLMSLGSFCRLCRLKRRLKQDRIMQVGGKMWNIRAWACCSGHWRLKLNIKAVKSVKGPTRAGWGSFAISLSVSSMFGTSSEHRGCFGHKGKSGMKEWAGRWKGPLKSQCSAVLLERILQARGQKCLFFLHNLIWFKVSGDALGVWK